jgi:hypothetical protein
MCLKAGWRNRASLVRGVSNAARRCMKAAARGTLNAVGRLGSTLLKDTTRKSQYLQHVLCLKLESQLQIEIKQISVIFL